MPRAGRSVLTVALLSVAAACTPASDWTPTVDRGQPGFDAAVYERDLTGCRHYAELVETGQPGINQRDSDTATSMGLAILAGTATAIFGGMLIGLEGPIAWVGQQVSPTARPPVDIQRKRLAYCMTARGYVLRD